MPLIIQREVLTDHTRICSGRMFSTEKPLSPTPNLLSNYNIHSSVNANLELGSSLKTSLRWGVVPALSVVVYRSGVQKD